MGSATTALMVGVSSSFDFVMSVRDSLRHLAGMATSSSATSQQRVKLPGFGLPMDHLPPKHYPFLLGDLGHDWMGITLHIREACMLKVIEELTNKPEWWRKVMDDEIADRWKQEMLVMDWAAYRRFGDFIPAMADTVRVTNMPCTSREAHPY